MKKDKVALLIRDIYNRPNEIKLHYTSPLEAKGLDPSQLITLPLAYTEQGKCPVRLIKEHLDTILYSATFKGATTLLVADSAYFKVLTKQRTAEPHHGYIMPCMYPGYEHLQVILTISYKALFYNPNLQHKLDISLDTLVDHMHGFHIELGNNILHDVSYPESLPDIKEALAKLHRYPRLSCDTETYSLLFSAAGIGTIAFAWSEHDGIAFCVDFENGASLYNPVKKLLRKFFETYTGELVYHNAAFDVKVLIYGLYMDSLLDKQGLIEGLEVMYKNVHDTKIITYLALNTTAPLKLDLKSNVFEFTGNYAQDDIKDITLIKKEDLLEYNITDAVATIYLYNKNYPKMVKDTQEQIYNEIMIPSMKVITQMELTGLPLNMETVNDTEEKLEEVLEGHKTDLDHSPLIWEFEEILRMEALLLKRSTLKQKQVYLRDFLAVEYNPASNKQTAKLLYDHFEMPVIDTTKTGLPAVGSGTLKKLLIQSTNPDQSNILKALIGINEVSIILNTFISAFIQKSIPKEDGWSYLHGNFNIGGTVSGRLSSSKPNLQNIPSTGSTYAKDIKKCFQAPPGYLFVGCDFSSLEDRISALTTKDPNKLKVYIDLYDGHCLRAYSYYKDQMPDIVNTVESINSISSKYPKLRQASKGPTFLLTYGGTYHGIMEQFGFSKEGAQKIEEKYHELYNVSDTWVKDKLEEATHTGFVTGAFGLRLRTPILSQTLLGRKSTPYEAAAEGRTAGNMFGQSWGLLNNRAAIEFQTRTLNSRYALMINPIAHIHDAQYFLVKNNLGCIHWLNKNLVECMQWQNHLDIQHDEVKLGGQVEIFYPDWSNPIKLSNNATPQEILNICHLKKDTENLP